MVGPLRIFAAIAPPDEVRLALIDQTSELDIPGRLVPPQNWHITLRFLGDIDEVAYERYLAELDQMELGASFNLTLDHLGAFPNQRKATVVWAGAARGQERLCELAEKADSAAGFAGVVAEERPFSPHLTLSRVRPPADVARLAADAELDISWRVHEFVVFESRLERGGVRYEPLERFLLPR